MRSAVFALGLGSILLLWTGVESAQAAVVRLTGWFACERCTASRAAKGDLRPSNPDCARQCIDKGSAPVFIDEQGRQLLKVRSNTSVKDDLGYHLEVTGEIEAGSSTITIETVKRLGDGGVSCSRPRQGTKN